MTDNFGRHLEVYWKNFVSWFLSLSERERKALLVLIVFAVVIVGYLMVWRPLNTSMQEADASYEREYDTLSFVKRNIEWVAILQKKQGAGKANTNLVGRISHSASRSSVVLTKIQPIKGGAVIWGDAVEYKKLLTWLLLLHNVENIEVQQIRINKGEQEGVVKVFSRLYVKK